MKQPLLVPNFSLKFENCGYNTATVRVRRKIKNKNRKNGYGGHLVFQNEPKNLQAQYYKLIVHWKPLKPLLSEIETLLPKTHMRVTATALKKAQPIKA